MEIPRDRYLDRLIAHHFDGQMKFVTGIRGCGKSYLLECIFRRWLTANGVEGSHILSFNLDQPQDYTYRDPARLANFVRGQTETTNTPMYLFVHEAQLSDTVPNPVASTTAAVSLFDVLSDLRSSANLDIYITSSNSRMPESSSSSEFSGYGVDIPMHPLTFTEYYGTAGGSPRAEFERYARFGGMPVLMTLPDDASKIDYLRSLFSQSYLRDIAERSGLMRETALNELVDLLCASTGLLTNPTKMANILRARQQTVSHNTVRAYLRQLEDAFVFSECRRYEVKTRSYFDFPVKYYCEDVGLCNVRTDFRELESVHLMENIVYSDLRARGLSVDVGVVYERERNANGNSVRRPAEIDFVAYRGNRRTYIQCADAIENDSDLSLAVRALQRTGDSFPKVIVHRDENPRWYDEKGILHIGITDFLLDQTVV